ncbi:hypothetical protein, partial [Myroides sp. 1372]|uniref:hypothetical protein n=2 Tax=Myroides TaxID=76831 RepID=UPI002577E198
MKRQLIPLMALVLSGSAMAQVGIGTKKPANSAQLDIVSPNKGVLLPRIELIAENDRAPIIGEMVESLLIYHIGNSVLESGFYYWENNKWKRLQATDSVSDRMNNSFTIGPNPDKNGEESLIITDTKNHSVYLSIASIANNEEFIKNLVENQEFITQLGDNIEFINQIINNEEFITNIINELNNTYGNVGYDTTTNQFFYYDADGNPVTIDISTLTNTKIQSFVVDQANNVLVITDTDNTRFEVTLDELGAAIANNEVFITELGDNIEFINQITNNEEFINNIINELNNIYGNVGYDTTTNQFFYYDADGNPVTIDISTLTNTKIQSFVVDQANNVLVITDTDNTRFEVTLDELGAAIANNEVFITELGDNIEFINQITNNEEFITNIIEELNNTYGNVGYDTTTNQFFYYDADGNPVTIDISTLTNTKIQSFVVDQANNVLVITDTDNTRFEVTLDELGAAIANNEVFITELGDNIEFINQITNNEEFITNIIEELNNTYGNVGYDTTTNQFFYYDADGNPVTIDISTLTNTKIQSFVVDQANNVLVITDTDNTRFEVTLDELGAAIANNEVFITELGDNIEFINQITNNEEFITNIIEELNNTYGNVGYDTTTNQFFYYDADGNPVTIDISTLTNTKIQSFVVDQANNVLVITDTDNTRFEVTLDELGAAIANNEVFITELGDNIEFINQITNNEEFITNIIEELNNTYGNVGYDTTTNQFFYYDADGNPVTIDISTLTNTKIQSFVVDQANNVLVITDTDNTRFEVTLDELGAAIANNEVFITELGDNIEFINQITNNEEFINNIINELNNTYGNVGYDTTTNQFFYYDADGNPVTIDISTLTNTKIQSFVVDQANNVLVITDTDNTRFEVTLDELGAAIANNEVFITELGDNIEFINQITNNEEFINNIINELNNTYGNVGYDTTTNQFFYYDADGNPVTIDISTLTNTKIQSFVVDQANNVLVITDTDNTRFEVTLDDLGAAIANNDVFVTNLVENQEFITQLVSNEEFITNIIEELKDTYGNVGYDTTTNQFFYYDADGNPVTIDISTLTNTKIQSFVVDQANNVLVITDTDNTRFEVTLDDLGAAIANNDVFVTNLVENQEFITQLVSNEEFITNIIEELKDTYGNVGYDTTTNQFFYYDADGNPVTIDISTLTNTKIQSFVVDQANNVLVITDTDNTRFEVTLDDLGAAIANNDVFVTNLVENQEFITQLVSNEEFITNIIEELKDTYG